MKTTHNFDRIMRKDPLDGGSGRRDHTAGTLVVIDTKKKQFLPAKPFVTIGKELRYWLVKAGPTAEGQLPPLTVRDFAKDRSLRLNIGYAATCPVGAEAVVALALGLGEDPAVHFHQLLEEWVQLFARDRRGENEDPISNFASLQAAWQKFVAREGSQKTGLQLEVRISIEGASELGTIELRDQPVTARVKDYDGDLPLTYKADLEVDPANSATATLNLQREAELRAALTRAIRDAVGECTLQGLYFGPSAKLAEESPVSPGADQAVEAGLQNRIKTSAGQALKPFGRHLSFFSLTAIPPNFLPQQNYTIEHKVECRLQQYPQPVTVSHSLLMNLTDAGRFVAHRVGDVHQWAHEKLKEITGEMLFKVTYVDLLLGFEGLQASLEKEMQAWAKTIGFEVRHLVLLPNLEEIEWHKKGFSINVSEAFDTKVPGMVVNLEIVGSARIRDLKDPAIKPRLDRNAKVPAEVEAEIKMLAAGVLHRTDPERFYMEFTADRATGNVKKGVEHEMRQAISAVVEIFRLDNFNFVIKRKETDLKKRLDALLSGQHKVEVDAVPFRVAADNERVRLIVQFRIKAVDADGWGAFLANRYATVAAEIEAIKETFKLNIKAKVETVPIENLRWADERTRLTIEELIVRPSANVIQSAFGLWIEIITTAREATASTHRYLANAQTIAIERGKTDVEIAKANEERRLANLKEYEDKLKQLYLGGDVETPEIKNLKRLIAEIQDEHTSRAITPRQAALDIPAADRGQFSFEDYRASGAPPQNLLKSEEQKESETAGEKKTASKSPRRPEMESVPEAEEVRQQP